MRSSDTLKLLRSVLRSAISPDRPMNPVVQVVEEVAPAIAVGCLGVGREPVSDDVLALWCQAIAEVVGPADPSLLGEHHVALLLDEPSEQASGPKVLGLRVGVG